MARAIGEQTHRHASTSVEKWSSTQAAVRDIPKELWVKTITLPYTAKFSDSLIGVERLKLANEGAARTNIQGLVEWLAAYKPQAP